MALTLPVVNGSNGVWGTILNGILTELDTRVAALDTDTTSTESEVATLKTRIAALESGAGTGVGGLTVATSTTRPELAIGQVVLETDTGFIYYGGKVNNVAFRLPFPGSHLAKLKRTSDQAFGNGGQNALAFETAEFDRLGGWNSVTPTRYTAKVPGFHEFTGGISWGTGGTNTSTRVVYWTLNGLLTVAGSSIIHTEGPTGVVMQARTLSVKLAVGDYVELWGQQGSGTTLQTNTTVGALPTMQVTYLGHAL
jgi:hypothetical protein